MTTDIDKLTALLSEFGIPFNHSEDEKISIEVPWAGVKRDKVIGYGGFSCEFNFDNGKFVNVGIWE